MSLFNFNISGLGLDISDLSIKLVQAGPSRKGYRLLSCGSIKVNQGLIEQGEIVDQKQVISLIEKLKNNTTGKLVSEFVVASLPETKTFLKVFKLQKKEEEEPKVAAYHLVKAIEAELPKEIPLPLENIIYDYQLLEQSFNHWQVLVGAAPLDIILEYTDVIKQAGFKLLALEIEAQSIVRALLPSLASKKKRACSINLKIKLPHFLSSFRLKKPIMANKANKSSTLQQDISAKGGCASGTKPSRKDLLYSSSPSQGYLLSSAGNEYSGKVLDKIFRNDLPIIIADLGATRSSLIVYHHNTIQFTRSIQLSGKQLSKQIADKLKLSPAKAEQAKIICGLEKKKCKGKVSSVVKNWAELIISEILATQQYYQSLQNQSQHEFQEIILCGGGAGLIGLADLISKKLEKQVSVADPLEKFVSLNKEVKIPKKSLSGFTTAIGLAMRSI